MVVYMDIKEHKFNTENYVNMGQKPLSMNDKCLVDLYMSIHVSQISNYSEQIQKCWRMGGSIYNLKTP